MMDIDYRGGCGTVGAILGLMMVVALVVCVVFFGGQVIQGVEQSRTDREQARLDRQWAQTQEAQAETEREQIQLERDRAYWDNTLATLRENQEFELDKMYARQDILDHNLAVILAVARSDPELATWVRSQLGPEEPEEQPGIHPVVAGILLVFLGLMVVGIALFAVFIRVYRPQV